jgi:Ca2+/Na+ antiporter
MARRGAALVGETFNSNTINLCAGVVVPALFVALGALSGTAKLELAWLVGMTLVTLTALAAPRGLGRAAGAAVVALYFLFAAIQLLL